MAEELLLEGERVVIGGREFIVPPLSFGRIKKLMPLIKEASNPDVDKDKAPLEQIEGHLSGVCQIIFLAIQRNYPEITQEEVEDLIDLKNATSTLREVLRVSGFVPAGENPPGEVPET